MFGFGLYQSCGNRGSVGRMSVFWFGVVGGVGGELVGNLDQDLEGWCYVCVSLDYLCR